MGGKSGSRADGKPLSKRIKDLHERIDVATAGQPGRHTLRDLLDDTADLVSEYSKALEPQFALRQRDAVALTALLHEATPRLFDKTDPDGRLLNRANQQVKVSLKGLRATYAAIKQLERELDATVKALRRAVKKDKVGDDPTIWPKVGKLLVILLISAFVLENGGSISAFSVEATIPDGQLEGVLEDLLNALGSGRDVLSL